MGRRTRRQPCRSHQRWSSVSGLAQELFFLELASSSLLQCTPWGSWDIPPCNRCLPCTDRWLSESKFRSLLPGHHEGMPQHKHGSRCTTPDQLLGEDRVDLPL